MWNSALYLKIKQVLYTCQKAEAELILEAGTGRLRVKKAKPLPFGSGKLLNQPSYNVKTYSTKWKISEYLYLAWKYKFLPTVLVTGSGSEHVFITNWALNRNMCSSISHFCQYVPVLVLPHTVLSGTNLPIKQMAQ